MAIRALSDLSSNPANANTGSVRGTQLLKSSIEECGGGRPIVVDKNGIAIAGNKTLQRAMDAGLSVVVVPSDGSKLVVAVRTDLDLDDETTAARRLAYLDNRTSELGLVWDAKRLEQDLSSGLALGGLFTEQERRAVLAELMQPQHQELLLRSPITFEREDDRQVWLSAVERIASRPGATFPDKLDGWVEEQLGALAEVSRED